MNVIKHGLNYGKTSNYICTCISCKCCFEFSEDEIETYLNEEEYVICPECHHDNKLTRISDDILKLLTL